MNPTNCTPTIQEPDAPSPAVYAIALPWFAGRRLGWWLGQGADRLLLWAERARQRRQLAELDDYMLRDIGLTRADVANEVRKAFWQQ